MWDLVFHTGILADAQQTFIPTVQPVRTVPAFSLKSCQLKFLRGLVVPTHHLYRCHHYFYITFIRSTDVSWWSLVLIEIQHHPVTSLMKVHKVYDTSSPPPPPSDTTPRSAYTANRLVRVMGYFVGELYTSSRIRRLSSKQIQSEIPIPKLVWVSHVWFVRSLGTFIFSLTVPVSSSLWQWENSCLLYRVFQTTRPVRVPGKRNKINSPCQL